LKESLPHEILMVANQPTTTTFTHGNGSRSGELELVHLIKVILCVNMISCPDFYRLGSADCKWNLL